MLTVLGKIKVVNSLIASLVVYKLLCLSSPPSQLFKEYNEMISKFIWKSKAKKIKYEKAIQDYHRGGVKLVDLKSKDRAMKASWVGRALATNREDFPLYYWLPIDNHIIWQCNTLEGDFKANDTELSLPLQAWKVWSSINAHTPQN